jgi:hypothetical protein
MQGPCQSEWCLSQIGPGCDGHGAGDGISLYGLQEKHLQLKKHGRIAAGGKRGWIEIRGYNIVPLCRIVAKKSETESLRIPVHRARCTSLFLNPSSTTSPETAELPNVAIQ